MRQEKSWNEQIAMMSPKQEREFWLAEVARRMIFCPGLLVNRRYMPSLDRTPQLRRLIAEGKLVRVREKTWSNSSVRRTYLRLPE